MSRFWFYLKQGRSFKLTMPFRVMKRTRTTSSGMPTATLGARNSYHATLGARKGYLEVTIPGTDYGTYMYDRKAINEDYRMYLKSKGQLVGIIKSMTDKLLDDKMTTTFQQCTIE